MEIVDPQLIANAGSGGAVIGVAWFAREILVLLAKWIDTKRMEKTHAACYRPDAKWEEFCTANFRAINDKLSELGDQFSDFKKAHRECKGV